jgi:hypothetical protein
MDRRIRRPLNRRLVRLLAVCLLLGMAAAVAQAGPADAPEDRAEISQHGITWTFEKPSRTGRYVTGDWWVAGPVTVKAVAPAPEAGRNGSVVDPPAGDKQGYDDRCSGFDASLRAAVPLVLKPGQSLVTTASLAKVGDRTPDTVPGQGARGPLRTAAVLTCVASPPPADAFRPAYVGTWRESFTAGQLRRDLLPRLEPPEAVPEVAPYERVLERIWLDHQREWVNRMMHPLENMPDYGREITDIVSSVGLLVLLDDPQRRRETLLLRFVQKGIDYYGTVRSNDDLWVANGGHNSGRKWPILFAGHMLGHEGMMRVRATFQEDQQTYAGKGFKGQTALWRITLSNPNTGHEEADPATWTTFGKGDNNGTKAEAYRKLNGPTWVGQALAARLTGMVECWGHPVYFEYVDRWVAEEGAKAAGSPFVTTMWERYRGQADAIGKSIRDRRAGKPAR